MKNRQLCLTFPLFSLSMEVLLRRTGSSSIYTKLWWLSWCFMEKLTISMIKKILTHYYKVLIQEVSLTYQLYLSSWLKSILSNALILYTLRTPKKCFFWCFPGLQNWNIGPKWVKDTYSCNWLSFNLSQYVNHAYAFLNGKKILKSSCQSFSVIPPST